MFTERYHTLELATNSPERCWKKAFTVSALSVAQDFEKLLREVSSSWALLVALSYQNWELGKVPSAGARQQRKTHPVGSHCRRPCTLQGLWETGRKKYFLLRFLPVSSTGITPNVPGEIFAQSTSMIIEQAKKNLRSSKYLDLRRTKMLMTCTILYHMCVLQIFIPGCGLPFRFLISVFRKASVFNLIRFKSINFFFCHS